MRCFNCDAKLRDNDGPCWKCGYQTKNDLEAKHRELVDNRIKDKRRASLNLEPKDKPRKDLDRELPEVRSSRIGKTIFRIVIWTVSAALLALAIESRLDARMPDELKIGVIGWSAFMGMIALGLAIAESLPPDSTKTKTLDFVTQILLGVWMGLVFGCISKKSLPGYLDFGVLGWAAFFGMFAVIRELLLKRSPVRIVLSVLLSAFVLLVLFMSALQDELHWRWATITHAYSGYLEPWPQGRHAAEARNLDDEINWNRTKGATTIEPYNDYVRKQPQGKYLPQARDQIEELRWFNAKTNDTLELYKEYLKFHSQGRYASQANERMEELDWDKANKTNTVASYREFINAHQSNRHANDAVKRITALIAQKESVRQPVDNKSSDKVSPQTSIAVVITPLRHPKTDVIYGAEARDQASGALLATAKQVAMEGNLLVVEQTQYSRNGEVVYKSRLFFSPGDELVKEEKLWGEKAWDIFRTKSW